MVKREQKKTFDVWAEVKMTVTAKVEADTLEQALEVGRTLSTDDFVYNEPGEIIQSEHRLTAIFE